MTTYAVIRKSDQVEVYRYVESAPVEWSGWEFATHDHVVVPDAPAPPAPPGPAPIKLSKLAFRNRFTSTEKATIELMASHNPAAAMSQRQLAAALRAQLADQRDAQFIDLSRPDTRAGVQQLEALGMLAAGRATVILDTLPDVSEVYVG